ncbi:MAG: heat-shock protein Hsp20 [Rhodoferax sp.]|nr:heat-shock protein Hsp20 [Rhodoferax sp.]
MFFATTSRVSPALVRRSASVGALRSLDRLVDEQLQAPLPKRHQMTQDEQSYTLTFDVPGIAKEQLSIGIEGNIVRIESQADAPRSYKAAYELPQDIDVAASDAKLEHGVLTLKLGKKVPVSNVAKLAIN